MDTAVALVDTYLRLNGFFTVTELPVIAPDRAGNVREITDIDVLAFRLPQPEGGAVRARRAAAGWLLAQPDPALACDVKRGDLLICEVKEREAALNPAVEDPDTLSFVVTRFGSCPADAAEDLVKELRRKGRARSPVGHLVRIVAFGSSPPAQHHRYDVILLGHVLDVLQRHVRENWAALSQAQHRDPVLGLLALMEKAERKEQRGR